MRLMPNPDFLNPTVNGRTYLGVLNTPVDVPDFDGEILTANGWLLLPPVAAEADPLAFQIANNLSEGIAATQRSNLGLGTAATHPSTDFIGYGSPLVLPKTIGEGIQIDPASPTFGWKDILGKIIPKTTGANTPALTTYITNIRELAFAAGDLIDLDFHIPHDYVPGTDLFVHVHWSHNGTNISGNLINTWYASYAKGHNQQNFSAEVTNTQTVSTPNITTVPQYRHRIDEFQLSASSPTANQLDTAQLEPDGIIVMNFSPTTIPTITGGAAKPFIHFIDIHYQSIGSGGTKQKAPNFYA